jgi:hypothetical protein
MLLQVQQIVLLNERRFEDMNIVGQLVFTTCRPNILAVIHAK